MLVEYCSFEMAQRTVLFTVALQYGDRICQQLSVDSALLCCGCVDYFEWFCLLFELKCVPPSKR